MLMMVLGISVSALAQEVTEETATEFTLGEDGFSVVGSDGAAISCFDAFRDEQEELVVSGSLTTSASDAARACEGFGIANPYPAPYFYDSDGFLYTYDPIEGIYNSPDPDNGVVYVYDPTSGTFSTYDPVNGVYL